MTNEAGSPDEAWAHGVAAVVCYDAGAAAHVFAWLASDPRRSAVVYAEGPAARQAASLGLRLASSLESTLGSADWALVGTGWQSDLERQAMRVCAASGIPCIAVVDHWVNYPDRFLGLEVDEYPQQVVVTDRAAEALAREQLSWATVTLWPNDQASQFVREVRRYGERDDAVEPYLLWLGEPIRVAGFDLCDPLADDRLAPRLWNLVCTAAAARSLDRVMVRMHPSQEAASYELTPVRVEVHEAYESPLADDVSRAALCLGINSYALYLSVQSGVKTASVAHRLGIPALIPSGLVPKFN